MTDRIYISGVRLKVTDQSVYDLLVKIAKSASVGAVIGGPTGAAKGVAKELAVKAVSALLSQVKAKVDCKKVLAAVSGALMNPRLQASRSFQNTGVASLVIAVPVIAPTPNQPNTTAEFNAVVRAEMHGKCKGRIHVVMVTPTLQTVLDCCSPDYTFTKGKDGRFSVHAPAQNRTTAVHRG